MATYTFPKLSSFVNRAAELDEMEHWWSGDDPNALLVFGRRRVGKSWLFRRFAHGKPAIILVGERLPPGAQLRRFASELAPHLGGVTPQIDDVPGLFRLLLGLGAGARQLVVVDELPYLLPPTEGARERMLTAIQAAMEERDGAGVKLLLCGSQVAVMEALMRSGSGLSGRLRALQVHPMDLRESRHFIDDADPIARIERYAVSGGMARSLSLLGSGGSLRDLVCRNVLNPNGPLFNDPRDVLEREFRQTDNYFGLLEALSTRREMTPHDLAGSVGRTETSLPAFLTVLQEMRLIERRLPFGAEGRSPGLYRLSDPFLRFWFRYVFPFQESLAAGLAPDDLWDSHIAPSLAQHVSWTFEDLCRRWVREREGLRAPIVRSWWGSAGQKRVAPDRGSQEIDIVGGVKKKVALVGECKWTSRPMGRDVLRALHDHKLPAMNFGKLQITNDLVVVLFSRSGFTDSLRIEADNDSQLRLISAAQVVEELLA